MAKAAKAKNFKCRFPGCGQAFGAERSERGEHEKLKHPTFVPPAGARTVKSGRAAAYDVMDATAHIQAAATKIASEIARKRETLASVEKIKAEITVLDNQHKALLAMLPKV